ncbi:CLUMA_CG019278, isoform A [Clunio marinus]|uniref:CLUMA_CG019278, isoform A n=1 Tax=Clunio marinus TaxID=568069 RepID=A0A1J1J1A1_9DIPT|nr:CLUMA_CG019278, isoform A [Clunio marinus]
MLRTMFKEWKIDFDINFVFCFALNHIKSLVSINMSKDARITENFYFIIDEASLSFSCSSS